MIYPPVTDIVEELKSVTDIQGKKVLEVGAGTGRDGLRISRAAGSVFLLDYSKQSLILARHYMQNDEVGLIMADARWSPFPDGTFDIIFHQGLLEHFTDPLILLSENYRILKDGGLLIVDVPQTFHIYTIFKHILMMFGLWFGGWERQFTVNSLSNLLKRAGFRPIHQYGDWSRPGIFYKIIREVLKKIGVVLPMYPRYFNGLTKKFYRLQKRLRRKKIFLYTCLSIGIIAKK